MPTWSEWMITEEYLRTYHYLYSDVTDCGTLFEPHYMILSWFEEQMYEEVY